jgi:hypothetical protein
VNAHWGAIVGGVIVLALGVPVVFDVKCLATSIQRVLVRRYFRNGDAFAASDERRLWWMIRAMGFVLSAFGVIAIAVGISG